MRFGDATESEGVAFEVPAELEPAAVTQLGLELLEGTDGVPPTPSIGKRVFGEALFALFLSEEPALPSFEDCESALKVLADLAEAPALAEELLDVCLIEVSNKKGAASFGRAERRLAAELLWGVEEAERLSRKILTYIRDTEYPRLDGRIRTLRTALSDNNTVEGLAEVLLEAERAANELKELGDSVDASGQRLQLAIDDLRDHLEDISLPQLAPTNKAECAAHKRALVALLQSSFSEHKVR